MSLETCHFPTFGHALRRAAIQLHCGAALHEEPFASDQAERAKRDDVSGHCFNFRRRLTSAVSYVKDRHRTINGESSRTRERREPSPPVRDDKTGNGCTQWAAKAVSR